MFPNKVYHCSCVSLEIKLCLVNGQYSLKDICKKLNETIVDKKIYCSKCGDDLQNVIFSCVNHMQIVILSCTQVGTYVELTETAKNSCKICIKNIYKRHANVVMNIPTLTYQSQLKKRRKCCVCV